MIQKESKLTTPLLSILLGIGMGLGAFFFTSSVSPDIKRIVEQLVISNATITQAIVDMKDDIHEIKETLKLDKNKKENN